MRIAKAVNYAAAAGKKKRFRPPMKDGYIVVVNRKAIKDPEFHLGRVKRVFGTGNVLEVEVLLGGFDKQRLPVGESALGIIGFLSQESRIKRLTGVYDRSWARKLLAEDDWVANGAVKEYLDAEAAQMQKLVRKKLQEEYDAEDEADEDFSDALPAAEAEAMTSYADAKDDPPAGMLKKEVTVLQSKMHSALLAMDDVSVGKVWKNGGDFIIEITVMGQGDFSVITQDDENWDLFRHGEDGDAYAYVQDGSFGDILDAVELQFDNHLLKDLTKEQLVRKVLTLREHLDRAEDRAAEAEQRYREKDDIPESESQRFEESCRRMLDEIMDEEGNSIGVWNRIMKSWWANPEVWARRKEAEPRKIECWSKVLLQYSQERGYIPLPHWQRGYVRFDDWQ